MSNFDSVQPTSNTTSKSLRYAYDGAHESLGWSTTQRVDSTLLMMALTDDGRECFTLAVSIDLAHNLMAGCEHYGSETCECATWGDQA